VVHLGHGRDPCPNGRMDGEDIAGDVEDEWEDIQDQPRHHLSGGTDRSCLIVVHTSGVCQVQVYSGRGSGQVRTGADEGEGQMLDKRLVQLELVTDWIQRLRTTSIDPLHRFRSGGDGDGDRRKQE